MLYWFIIVPCVGLVLAIFISLFTRIIKDNLEYNRKNPKEKKSKEKPHQFTDARITVNRRESSGLTSFAVWDFFLNGENIGSIKDGASITIRTGKRINELIAKDSHGTQCPPITFFVESGYDSQVVFNNGRFQNPQKMDIAMPPEEGSAKIARALKSEKLTWLWLAVSLGYYTAVFFLIRRQIAMASAHSFFGPEPSREGIYLMAPLPVLPLIVIFLIGTSAYKAMVNYLSFKHPEEWGRISSYMFGLHWNNNIIFLDGEIDDPEYDELKIQYERVLALQLFSMLAFIGIFAYIIITAASR